VFTDGDGFLGKLTLVRSADSTHRDNGRSWVFEYSRSKRWIVDRATLKQARTEDLQYIDDPEYLDFLLIYFANGRYLVRTLYDDPALTVGALEQQYQNLGKGCNCANV
jgi:hypothetical protein